MLYNLYTYVYIYTCIYVHITSYNDALLKVRRDPYHKFWRPITVSKIPTGSLGYKKGNIDQL